MTRIVILLYFIASFMNPFVSAREDGEFQNQVTCLTMLGFYSPCREQSMKRVNRKMHLQYRGGQLNETHALHKTQAN